MNHPGAAGIRRPRVAATAAIAAAGLSGLYFVNPNTTHVPLCPLHAMTGLWCPLCGSTRACYALLHGQLHTALSDNALFVLGLPLLLLWWFWRQPGNVAARTARTHGRGLQRAGFWAVLAVGLIFGIVRNLPWGSWLAPPA